MAKKKDRDLVIKRCPPAMNPEATASSQVITHYLKLGSTKEKIEKEILEKQKELIAAKTEALQSTKRIEELYTEAMEAMKDYGGRNDDIF